MPGVEEPPVVPTLMSARTLVISSDRAARRYVIAAGSEFVGAGDYEEWREPPRRKRFFGWKLGPVFCRRITIRTARGEALCVLDSRDPHSRDRGFLLLDRDNIPIGSWGDRSIFDRHDRPIARYQSTAWWKERGDIINGEDEHIATIEPWYKGSTIDFVAPTSTEFRLLLVCTAFVLHYVHDQYGPPEWKKPTPP